MDTKTIRIDDQVYAELQRRAKPFEDTPNSVLRRLLELDPPRQQGELTAQLDPDFFLFPHNRLEFENAGKLADWLRGDLKSRGGMYLCATARKYRRVGTGAIIGFHKDKLLVGHAQVQYGLKPYAGPEKSPDTRRTYEAFLDFDPESIKVYVRRLSFRELQPLFGKSLSWRAVQRLTWDDYEKLQSVVSKDGYL